MDDAPKVVGVAGWDALIGPFLDLKRQSKLILRLKRRTKTSHLIHETAKRPNITLLVILLLVNLLWAHVVGRAHVCVRVHAALIEDARQAKVTQLGI